MSVRAFSSVQCSRLEIRSHRVVAIEQQPPPACPADFPPLQSYVWSTSATPNRECPGKVYVTCPAVPDECVSLGVPVQPVANATGAGLAAGNNTASPTKSPVTGSLSSGSPTPGIGVTIPSSQGPSSFPPKKASTFPPTADAESGANSIGFLSRGLACLIVCALAFFV
jgi:hypothetical protein